MRITQVTIPYIPPQIDATHLAKNGKLLTDAEIQQVKNAVANNGRYRNIDVNGELIRLPFAVIVQEGEYFAVYKGSEKKIGSGTYGRVKLAQNLISGKWVALKVQPIGLEASNKTKEVRHELEVLDIAGKSIQVPTSKHPIVLERWSERKATNQHYMLMEYARGDDLFNIASNDAIQFSAMQWINIMLGMLSEAKRIHQAKILHRDIKLENIRYHIPEDEITLIDYGFSDEMDENEIGIDKVICGTPCYVAPENFVANSGIYSEKTEIYALGAAFALLLKMAKQPRRTSSELSFEETMQEEVIFEQESTLKTTVPRAHVFKRETREALCNYFHKMMSYDVAERPTVNEAITFMNKIKKSLTLRDKVLKVGLLDVDDYRQLQKRKSIADQNHFYAMLSQHDRVWLVDKTLSKNKLEYAALRSKLEQCDIKVADRLYVGASADQLLSPLSSYLQKQPGDYCYQLQNALTVSRPRRASSHVTFFKQPSIFSYGSLKITQQPAALMPLMVATRK